MDLKLAESASSDATSRWKYDVYLSFRGEDTRNTFTDHLYTALVEKGILTFRDDYNLEKGQSISAELFEVIETSRFSVVVLSKNYASSTWCLDELVKILECQRELGQTVFPVFYHVDPPEVSNQRGDFAEAFAIYGKRFEENLEKVHRWRSALTEVAHLSGWHLRDGSESKFIQQIVKEILRKLRPIQLLSPELLVVASRVEKILPYIELGSNDVRILGICGMGGVGKSTIARVIYNRLSYQFEGSCFLPDVREVAQRSGLICLQERLLYDILLERDLRIHNVHEGVNLIRKRLKGKRIFLVLDDVDDFEQLEILAVKHECFGLGSRIIITSRDRILLSRHGVDEIYSLKELSYDEALHLFSLKTFKRDHPPEDYKGISNQFLKLAAGLPLAINAWGSFLCGRTKEEWERALERAELVPMNEIYSRLRISFDGLHKAEKEIFLYIACFFEGNDKDRVIEILQWLDPYMHFELQILIEKSLVKVTSSNQLCMHNLLQQMGREIVCQESPKEPGKRSRLWVYEDINDVLTANMGTEAIEAIFLDLPLQKKLQWNPKAFSKMPNLKLLKICKVQLLHGLTHFPNALRFLEWSDYPLKSLPPNFQPDQLVELNMCHSKIELLWERVKYLDSLKFIKLSHSRNLMRTPDFTGVPNLQRIDLEGCANLIEVHPSIGVLKSLTLLNLKDCASLESLPGKIETESLEILILSGCSKLKKIPEFAKNMQQLLELYLNGTAIGMLPSSIGHLTNLALLDLSSCKNLVSLPHTILGLKSLRVFIVSGCSKLAIIFPTQEPEIELISSAKQKFLYEYEEKEVQISDEEGRMPVFGAETETACSQTEGEGQIKSELTTHVDELIDPPSPLAVSTTGTSKGAAVELSRSGSSKLVELPEPEIMPSSLEKYGLLSAHGTEVMEEKGKMPILDTEIETLPSQPKEEGWTEFKLPKNAGEPIEPLTAPAALTSGTSKRAVGETVSATMLPSGKGEIEIAPIDGQLLLEESTRLKRSIGRTSLNILSCMSDVTARRIGVHGSGGIGKTSVLKALYPIIKDLFDVVIWVTVSRNWSRRKVQDEVLQQLSLSSKDLETDEIAEKLFQVLKSQRFLLLLDDVWEWIDLNAVGIPNPTLENSSRIILATRSPDVCRIMAADREVPVERLLPEEAWELFQEQVGSVINCPDIQLYAYDIQLYAYDMVLRHLKVSFYGSVNQSECVRLPHELVPHGIISSLCELETLSIDVFPGDKRWDKNVDFILNEMGNLTKLITFCCYFPEVKFLERFLEKSISWKIQGLTDFKFVVGPDVKCFRYQVGDNLEFEYVQWGQCLRFVNGDEIRDAVRKVLTCSTAFYLDHHIKVRSLSDFGISNLNGLRLCIVRDCPNIKTVIASEELVIFPILEHLSIYYLSNLGRLWEGMIPRGSFDKLRILTVHACPKLQFVFASSMLQFFSNLEELIVEHCPGITEIIFQDQVVDSGSATLPRLKTLKLHYLLELVAIMQGTWPPLENISFYNCPMLKKLVIDSNTSHSIKEIKAENHWWEKLEWQDTSIRSRLHAHFIPISDYSL